MKNIILMISAVLIAGCAGFPQLKGDSVSYVAPEISPSDAEEVAADMAEFLGTQLPAAKTTITLEFSNTLLHSILRHELKDRGFGLIETTPEPGQQVVPLRYFVTTLDGGVLVRMKYREQVAGRFYSRLDDGDLSFASNYAVREAAQ